MEHQPLRVDSDAQVSPRHNQAPLLLYLVLVLVEHFPVVVVVAFAVAIAVADVPVVSVSVAVAVLVTLSVTIGAVSCCFCSVLLDAMVQHGDANCLSRLEHVRT